MSDQTIATLATLASQIEVLATEMRGLRGDSDSLRDSVDGLRNEFRSELKAVRGDLALITHMQNSEIESNKKKLPGSLRGLPGFMGG